jgi:Tol biopolymer transport system component/tRNA A-37 threonylcarbamoyl transferase component Bud32
LSETISPNTTLAHYLIISRIGAGGMGEVYRARDPRLDREVAIKMLPKHYSSDSDRLQRFEQEARATSALNHPNILTVYDIGTYEGSPYIVAELLSGEELREQLNDGTMSQRNAIDYAHQIAQGLAAAHEKGITHRDLKPENLFVTTDGRVKILDFGLAKLRPQRDQVVSSEIATEKQITDPGTVMGTVGYMSPAQVRGQIADHRSDIFSFGSILYEMLSGKRAFQRETAAETMTAILKEEPQELSETNTQISLPLEKVLRRCLQKKPEQRFHSAHDLAFALEALSTLSGSQREIVTSPVGIPTTRGARLFANARLAWIVVAGLLLGFLAALPFAIAHFRQAPPGSPPIVRYDIPGPAKTTLGLVRWPAIALSPDGSTVAFVATAEGVNRLYIRRRDETEVNPLPGTEGAADPVFSPNGRWIAFVADFTIKKVSLDGSVTAVMKVGDARGMSWLNDDTLIYTPEAVGGLFRISANGGDPQPVSKLDESKKERTHRWPQVLPSEKAVLFTVGTLDSPDSYERSNIEAVILATGERRVVLQGATMARYVPTGHLVFARGGGLNAVGFDPETLTTQGVPEPILQGVAGDETTGATHFSIADDGTLAYVPGGPAANLRRLFWADRSGNLQPINIPPAQYNDVRISPDGSRAVFLMGSSGSGDVWVYDFARATSTRLTFNVANASPVWSADSKSIYYTEIRTTGNVSTLLRKPADGSREAETVASLKDSAYIKAIKSDGTLAIFDYQMNTNSGDVVELPLEPNAQITRLLNTSFNEYAAALSADGRWLAYQSNESGRPEIFVRDLSASGGRFPISTDGGEEPRWSSDGRELYYRKSGSFMSVAVEFGPTLHAGAPKELFKGVYDLRSNSGVTYDVDPKHSRFLMIRRSDDINAPSQARVVLNWFNELRRIAPMK